MPGTERLCLRRRSTELPKMYRRVVFAAAFILLCADRCNSTFTIVLVGQFMVYGLGFRV